MNNHREDDLIQRLQYTEDHGVFDAVDAGKYAGPDEAIRAIQALTAKIAGLEGERDELREALDAVIPSALCGESWNLPDKETVSIVVTFGKLKAARAALSPKDGMAK